jgi:4-hydroxy-tetrahydrodipicolinate synthase
MPVLGSIPTSVITPFDNRGRIDEKGFVHMVGRLIETGSSAVVVGGSTGEAYLLSISERDTLFRLAVAESARQVPVVAFVSGMTTREAVECALRAADAGVDAVMVGLPPYSQPGQQALLQYVEEIWQQSRLPVLLHNHPPRTGICLSVSFVSRMAGRSWIIGLNEFGGDMDRLAELALHAPPRFRLYTAGDRYTLPAMSLGFTGTVSVLANLIGREIREMVEAYQSGEVARAASYHLAIARLARAVAAAGNPVGLKFLLFHEGHIDEPVVREPLQECTEEEASMLLEKWLEFKETIPS